MSAFRMLLAAGYSLKEAVEKVGRLPTKIEMVEIGRMGLIEERHLCGVGNCKTNKGVIRRIKYGKGNLGKNGYLKTELKMEK